MIGEVSIIRNLTRDSGRGVLEIISTWTATPISLEVQPSRLFRALGKLKYW